MKGYARLTMFLMILLVIMPLASKSTDLQEIFSVELRNFVEETRSMQPLKTKSMITKEVAEGIQKRRIAESNEVIMTSFPPSNSFISRDGYLEYINDNKTSQKATVRYQVDSGNKLDINILDGTQSIPNIYDSLGINTVRNTNYIRADMTNNSSIGALFNNTQCRVCDIAIVNKAVLHYAVIG